MVCAHAGDVVLADQPLLAFALYHQREVNRASHPDGSRKITLMNPPVTPSPIVYEQRTATSSAWRCGPSAKLCDRQAWLLLSVTRLLIIGITLTAIRICSPSESSSQVHRGPRLGSPASNSLADGPGLGNWPGGGRQHRHAGHRPLGGVAVGHLNPHRFRPEARTVLSNSSNVASTLASANGSSWLNSTPVSPLVQSTQ
jgi:hypothetical protein